MLFVRCVGLWLVLLVISTTEQNVSVGNTTTRNHATSKHTLLPTRFLNVSLERTILIHKSTETRLKSTNANTAKLQPSGFSNSHTFKSASSSEPESTRTQFVRNLYNSDTQSTKVHNLFKSTRIKSTDLQINSATKTAAVSTPDRSTVEVKTTETWKSNSVNSVTFGVYKPSIMGTGNSQISRHVTILSYGYLSVKISSTISSGNSMVEKQTHTRSATDHFQSKATNLRSSYESFYTRTSQVESSTLGHFLTRTQRFQPSRTIEPSSPGECKSLTEELQINTHITTSRFNMRRSSTIKDLSKIGERPHITLTFVSSQFKPQESNSYLDNTPEYLSSTTSANIVSRIKPTRVRNNTKTTANERNVKTQSQSGRPEKTIENLSASFIVKHISSTVSILTRASKNRSSSMRTNQSGYQSAGIVSTNEVKVLLLEINGSN